MNLNYTAVKGMSLNRQSWHEPNHVSHWTSDGRRTLCGLAVTYAADPARNMECKRCRRSREVLDNPKPTA